MSKIAKLAMACAALAVPVVLVAAPAQAAPTGDNITPKEAYCGHPAPQDMDPISGITGVIPEGRIHSGAGSTCETRGKSLFSDHVDYYCYTVGHDGYTWTYLNNPRIGKEGWNRDDKLPNGGSYYWCGF